MDLTEHEFHQWMLRSVAAKKVEHIVENVLERNHPLSKSSYRAYKEFYTKRKKVFGNSKIIKIATTLQSTSCYYTGQLLSMNNKDPWRATIEHKDSKINGGGDDRNNIVLAAFWINTLLSNAPITVKENVKHVLSGFKNRDVEYLTKIVNIVLKSYYIDDNINPWWCLINRPDYRITNRIDLINRLGENSWLFY